MTGSRGAAYHKRSRGTSGRDRAVERERAYRPQRPSAEPDWAELFGSMRRGVATYGPADTWPVYEGPCQMVLTGASNRPNILVVRCRCMAGTVHVPSARFYTYGPIGEAARIEDARELFRAHKAEREARKAAT